MELLSLGFPVLSREGDRLGRLVDVQGEWLVFESGVLFKVRRAAPKELAAVDEVEGEITLRAATKAVRHSPVLEDEEIDSDCAEVLRAHYERTTVYHIDSPREDSERATW